MDECVDCMNWLVAMAKTKPHAMNLTFAMGFEVFSLKKEK